MKISWDHHAKEDYQYWLKRDPKKVKRINQLIQAILESPYDGIGKPEALRFELAGCWSRRIDKTHRLVYYLIDDDHVVILKCKQHY